MAQDSERTAVYRLFDTYGALLYIGIAEVPERRWEQHAKDKSWWHLVIRKEVAWCETRSKAEEAEKLGIRMEKPVYNLTWSETNVRRRAGESRPQDPFRAPLVAALREGIQTGQYPRGHVFMDDPETALSLGVSPITFSVALLELTHEGLVSRGPLVWHRHKRARTYIVSRGIKGDGGVAYVTVTTAPLRSSISLEIEDSNAE
jgi:predicted GIY-YIG superfamily endonuclease